MLMIRNHVQVRLYLHCLTFQELAALSNPVIDINVSEIFQTYILAVGQMLWANFSPGN